MAAGVHVPRRARPAERAHGAGGQRSRHEVPDGGTEGCLLRGEDSLFVKTFSFVVVALFYFQFLLSHSVHS